LGCTYLAYYSLLGLVIFLKSITNIFVIHYFPEDVSAVKDHFKKLSAELVNLRSLLTAKSGIGLNGVILTDHREGTT